jgi:hypothetical protein
MAPYEMARDQCANFVGNGCLFRNPRRGRREGLCDLAGMKSRCPYFECSVLPLVDRIPRYAGVRNIYRAALSARDDPASSSITVEEERRCPCGQPRAPRHRYCSACAVRRRKARSRERTRKHREYQNVGM